MAVMTSRRPNGAGDPDKYMPRMPTIHGIPGEKMQ